MRADPLERMRPAATLGEAVRVIQDSGPAKRASVLDQRESSCGVRRVLWAFSCGIKQGHSVSSEERQHYLEDPSDSGARGCAVWLPPSPARGVLYEGHAPEEAQL